MLAAEPWALREKLCLATSVMKSGDQNWVSVSRAIKPFAEPGRPPDWFSQKHCASQYSELLESTEAPKRKRGERGEAVETVEDVIVRRLTAERIYELKKLIRETQEKHRKLKREAELIQAGHLDCRLDRIWGEIVQKRKQTEDEAEVKRKSTDAAYQARQTAKTSVKRVGSSVGPCPPEGRSHSLEPPPGDGASPRPLASGGQPIPSRSVLVSTVFTPAMTRESSLPSNGDVCQAALLEDSLQRRPLGQRTTPPPSPLLSELLKRGSLLPANPRLIGEGEASGQLTGPCDLQLAPPPPPGSQATGAPTLSGLLECGPNHFPAPPSFTPAPESVSVTTTTTTTPPAGDPRPVDRPVPAIAGGLAAVGTYGCQRVFGGHTLVCEDPREEEEEGEEEGGSFMGAELDLKTVGDIIAIIEDKTVENTEELDAAAVEAALSLCEESGRALPGGCWAGLPAGGATAGSGGGAAAGSGGGAAAGSGGGAAAGSGGGATSGSGGGAEAGSGDGAADPPSSHHRGPRGGLRTDHDHHRLNSTYPRGGLPPPPPTPSPPPSSSSSSSLCPEPECPRASLEVSVSERENGEEPLRGTTEAVVAVAVSPPLPV
ncbi:hypothetical protein NHX12_008752 [Muraenolepis orangiensis]|uniref:Bromodomain containing 8 n=1 Tax=Muraenolepis orangiensis TaxID=630683 RepID=A0A9Q0DLW7_9TELE|nr:hypothetical protein NHX12_008752 [Muraenolepis orangiensis]